MRPLSVTPWWDRAIHADRRPFLQTRSAVVRAVRAWFDAQGFTEIETAALQVSPGNEPHLSSFQTVLHEGGGGGDRTLHLHTSPEFACKKLIAAGEDKLVTFARVFRNGERGPLHHPEFTMLEWYRTRVPLETMMDDCAALLEIAAKAAGATAFEWRGRRIDPFAAPQRLTVAEAFTQFAGVDLLATLCDPEHPDRDALAREVARLGIRVAGDDTWSDLFSKVLSEKIEPQLGNGRATILHDYPLPEAALARPKGMDGRVAERFELYACGVELANAFGELTDPVVQRRRFEEAGALRRERYGDAPPIDEDFLAALAHMPEASGIALGLDRLVMLAAGAQRLDQVIWTPVVEAG